MNEDSNKSSTGQQQTDNNMVNELRNHHVKKLLNHLGGKDVPPYLQRAIKRSFSEFAEDITNEDKKNEQEIHGNR